MRPYTPLEFQAWYLRNEKNFTQREIARMLGVSESAISQRLHRLARRHNRPISRASRRTYWARDAEYRGLRRGATTKRLKLYRVVEEEQRRIRPQDPASLRVGRKWPACFVIATQRLDKAESLRRSASHSDHFRPNAGPIGSSRGSNFKPPPRRRAHVHSLSLYNNI